ncbi:MAG: 4-alpha-glucanotransferase [Phycisphaerae bacterium]|nr:4-alpha-glucanotransferase [Phycisphaerae bacterium]
MKTRRTSGILMHITSLPSKFGIGDIGPEAFEFADALARAHQSCWQVLPVNPSASLDHSPYSGISVFAGDPLLISPQRLYRQGLLTNDPAKNLPDLPADRVDFARVIPIKQNMLDAAFTRFLSAGEDHLYHQFCIDHNGWLDDFALFVTIRGVRGTGDWSRWPKGLRDRQPESLRQFRLEHRNAIEKEKFLQYKFFKQWDILKQYCNEHGILLIGDLPLYVAYDSADVWAHRQFFKLNHPKKPLFVSGMPPDMYSDTGQRWGHPVYDWAALRKDRYGWWFDRLAHNLQMFDAVRIDHFRGLVAFYRIPAINKTAAKGKWIRVPAIDFFDTLFKRFPECPLIIEDLGRITPAVRHVIDEYNFTGMRILQFGLPFDDKTNIHAPRNYVKNCVAYTGTHDNNTAKGWFDTEISDAQRDHIRAYFAKKFKKYSGKSLWDHPEELAWAMINLVMKSRADLAVIPLQDVLGLGAEARMNVPASVGDSNWTWRAVPGALTGALIDRLADLTHKTRRSPK